MQAAEMHHDLGLDERPDDEEFDDFILHVDGWLCEIKDAQIRDGLHVLGQAPDRRGPGQPRARDPACRAGLGRAGRRGAGAARRARPRRGRRRPRPTVDAVEAQARALVEADGGRRLGRRPRPPTRLHDEPEVAAGAARSPPTRWCRGWPARPTSSTPCCTPSTAASSRPGRPARRCAGWSTCCRPAATSTPSTRAPCPSRLAWETGQAMADSLVRALPRRDRRATRGRWACRVWGTSAMRTSGDDIAEVLALLGRAADVGRGVAAGQRPARRPPRRSWAVPAST